MSGLSSLVERLRASVTQARAIDRSELLREAADEIDLLTRERNAFMEDYRRLSDRWDKMLEDLPVMLRAAESQRP